MTTLKKVRDWTKKLIYRDTIKLEYLREQYRGYLHFSFDDVQICLHNLAAHKNEFVSIFDDPFLKQLKILHERYEAKFSLYVYLEDFLKLDSTWAIEFSTISSWLKFGLHARSDVENYFTCGYDEANNDYIVFCEKLIQVCGGVECLDRVPRLHNFGASLMALKAFRDAEYGIYGILTADDSRKVLHLTLEEQSRLDNIGYYFEEETGLFFKKTDIRLEWFDKKYKSKYTYTKPIYGKLEQDFINILLTYIKADKSYPMIAFTHEWRCYSEDGTLLPTMTWVDDICKVAVACGIPFEYPQNVLAK